MAKAIVYLRDSRGREWMWAVEGTDDVVRPTDLTTRTSILELTEPVVITDFKVVRDA